MKTRDVVAALAALAQDSRLAVYRLLVQTGPEGMAAGAVAEKLGLPPATLSFHLKELNNARLIGSRQEGRYIIYSANFEAMVNLVGFLTENCCGGDAMAPECQPATRIRKGARRRNALMSKRK
jgi:DNA-binding transcriptional ArsR family regulator